MPEINTGPCCRLSLFIVKFSCDCTDDSSGPDSAIAPVCMLACVSERYCSVCVTFDLDMWHDGSP